MKKILVIDDQPELLEMVTYILSRDGYAVVGAQSGRAGLEQAHAYRPDLVLCDIMMPGLSGYDVLRAMRRDLGMATTPFIFLTAKAAPEDLRAGMGLGADDYLTKPFTPSDLTDAVKAQLEKYAALQARHKQQMDLLRQGLSTILPHELRTPLTLILSQSSLLTEAYDAFDQASILDMVGGIHEAALRLHRILENLLIYVELEGDATLRLEHPYIPQVRAVAEEAARRQAEVHHRLKDLRLQVVEGAASVHPVHLRKIVEELVDNAFKFSREGLPVVLELAPEGEDLNLRVIDRGRGMTPEQVERIGAYIQFDRDRSEQQGSGLGLAIADRLAELYNGSLEVQSEDGGTTVRVYLPGVWSMAKA